MATMQCHKDYGFLPKTQPDPNLAVHVSLYRRSKYNITRIIVSSRIVDVTSGPELNHTYSYTSIIPLGLAAGDTPDAPHNHLGTRGPSSLLKTPTYDTKICRSLKDALQDRDLLEPHDVMKSPSQTSRRSTYSLTVPDAPDLPNVVVLARRLRKFGYINWRRLWET
ncbi:golgin candidate 5-like [Dorcoceras hygrometricum]|uniref:Golgin candidate 5-like n=1 Tax=Dorcoceras hygrometricum TaxID=472368 RepID=A0A2Z7BFQ5_9LAMI|nr:golgin candidate 5-like [Dorcoceras hygrometricum]